jgi:hypothetical protein
MSSPQEAPPIPSNRHVEPIAAWTLWAAMSLGALWFVAVYGYASPYGSDELNWLPVLIGDQPTTWQWLWSQHNEHRMVLPRLIYLGLGHLTGYNFRAGSFFSVAMLSGLSAALMLTARRLRGRTSLYDAFIPMVLLHWGHVENLQWGLQLCFVTAVCLACLLLLAVARTGERLQPLPAIGITVCVLGLGLCGSFGLAYLPAIAMWLGYAGIARWRDGAPSARRDGLAMLLLATLPAALAGVYFLGYTKPAQSAPPPGIPAALRTSAEFLSTAIGPSAERLWPISGLFIVGVAVLLAGQMVAVAASRPGERVRAAGFFCFLGGIASLSLGIGWGRAFFGDMAGFAPRYITLASPLLILAYLQLTAYGSAKTELALRRAMFLAMCVLVPINDHKGMKWGEFSLRNVTNLEADAQEGLSPQALAVRYGELWGIEPSVFTPWLDRLREMRLGPYRGLGDRPCDASQYVAPLYVPLPAGRKPDRVTLAGDRPYIERFAAPKDSALRRIDVWIAKSPRRPLPDRLFWTLRRVEPAGRAAEVASGCVPCSERLVNEYVALRFPPIPVGATGQFELALRLPGGASEKEAIALLNYPAASLPASMAALASKAPSGAIDHLAPPSAMALRAFLFLSPASPIEASPRP